MVNECRGRCVAPRCTGLRMASGGSFIVTPTKCVQRLASPRSDGTWCRSGSPTRRRTRGVAGNRPSPTGRSTRDPPAMTNRIETLVIGGGPAGLAMSYWLRQHGCEHLVLERGRLVERWRSERWDSLTLQFPNWMMLTLPGYKWREHDPDGFLPKDEVVHYLERYAASFGPPLRTGVRVTALRLKPGSARLHVETDDGMYEAAH